MFAKDLITTIVPSVKTSDTGNDVLGWMEFFKVSHLPIVKEGEFLGLISESDIYNLDCGIEPIGNHELTLISPYVTESQHVWEVVDVVSRLKLSLVPVLSEDKKYLGVITLQKLAQSLSALTAADQMGSIIVLEVGVRDYSLTEISRIVEENDAKILSLFVSGDKNSTQLFVTIKLNVTDITSVLQTFNRYNYTIKASFLNDDNVLRLYRERYESFLSYLSV